MGQVIPDASDMSLQCCHSEAALRLLAPSMHTLQTSHLSASGLKRTTQVSISEGSKEAAPLGNHEQAAQALGAELPQCVNNADRWAHQRHPPTSHHDVRHTKRQPPPNAARWVVSGVIVLAELPCLHPTHNGVVASALPTCGLTATLTSCNVTRPITWCITRTPSLRTLPVCSTMSNCRTCLVFATQACPKMCH